MRPNHLHISPILRWRNKETLYSGHANVDMRPLPRVPNPYPLVFSSIVCFYGDANCQSLSPSFSQSKSTDLWRRDASVNRKCCSGTGCYCCCCYCCCCCFPGQKLQTCFKYLKDQTTKKRATKKAQQYGRNWRAYANTKTFLVSAWSFGAAESETFPASWSSMSMNNALMESFLFNRAQNTLTMSTISWRITLGFAWDLPVIGDNLRCQTVSSESHKKVTMSIENLNVYAR